MQIGTTVEPGPGNSLPLSFIIGCDALTIEGPWHLSGEEQEDKIDLRNLALDLNVLVNVGNSNHLIHPGDIPYIKNILNRFQNGEFMEYDFRIIAPKGVIKPIHGSGKLVKSLATAKIIEDLDHLMYEDELQLKVYKYAEQVANIGSWTWNLQSDDLFFSEHLYRLLGENPYAIPLDWQVFVQYLHPDDRDSVLKFARQMKQQHLPLDVEFRLVNTHGETRYVNMKGEYFITRKQQGYFIGTMLDITESRQVNMLLKETNELLQSVFDATTSGISVLKSIRNNRNEIEDFEYLLADLQAEQLVGRKNLTGKKVSSIFPGIADTKLLQRFIEVVDRYGHDDFEQLLKVRGRLCWFRISCVKLHDGLVVTTEDITSKKQTEEEFRNEHSRFIEAQAIAHFGVFEWRPATGTFIWSDEMYRIHGLVPQSETITRERFFKMIHPEDLLLLKKLLFRSGNHALFQSVIHRVILPNGETRYLQRYFESFTDDKDRITHVSGIVQDVTERKRDELKIQQTSELLKGVIDAPNNRIIVFKAKRNEQGEILDFIFKLVSRATQEFYKGKNYTGDELSRVFPETFVSQFEAMKKVVVSGETHIEEQFYASDHFDRWFKITDAKFEDGIVRVWEDITERKKAELEVKENKLLLQSVLDTSLIGMSLLEAWRDEQGKIQDFRIKLTNKALEREVNRTDLVGKLYSQEFPGIRKTSLFDMMLRVVNTGVQEGMEYYYPYDGFDKWYSCMFVKKEDGLVATNLDITERKKTEREFIDNKNLLQSVFDASNDSIIVQRSIRHAEAGIFDFEIVAANEKAKLHSGQDKIIGKRFSDVFSNWISSGIMEKFIAVANTGSPEQFEISMRIGQLNVWFYVSILKLGDGVVFTSEDISLRKDAEQELTKNYEILQQAEEVAEMGSWEFVTETDKLYWSEGMYRLFALPPFLDVQPETYVQFAIPEDKQISETIVHFFRHDQQSYETILRIKVNGTLKTLKIKATPLKNEKGIVDRIIGVDLDITSLQKSRNKLAELNASLQQKNLDLQSKNEELSHLAFITSHDLREPLRKIRTYGNLLLQKEADSLTAQGKKYTEKILSSAERMHTLFDNILSFSQITFSHQAPFSKVDLNRVLEDVIHELSSLINKTNSVIHHQHLPVIEGDELQITLLFNNILSNAIKFQPVDNIPQIQIESKIIKGAAIQSSLVNPLLDYLLIEITDNGLGFEEEYAAQIFNLFQRLHQTNNFQGTGLGLAICKKIMENHRGFIAARGNLGKGATFYSYFPMPWISVE